MNLASALAVNNEEQRGPLEEDEGEDRCPLCMYQDESIILKLNNLHSRLVNKISTDELYKILVQTYEHDIIPLQRQGRQLLPLTEEQCRIHFDKHVINPTKSVVDDIYFCERIQRHIRENVAIRDKLNGYVHINKAYTKEWVTISKHKLDLIRFYTLQKKRDEESRKGQQVSNNNQDLYNFT